MNRQWKGNWFIFFLVCVCLSACKFCICIELSVNRTCLVYDIRNAGGGELFSSRSRGLFLRSEHYVGNVFCNRDGLEFRIYSQVMCILIIVEINLSKWHSTQQFNLYLR